MIPDLAQHIASYYFEHSSELPTEKQFHLGSRLAAWSGDERALQLMRNCRGAIVPEAMTTTALARLFQHLRDTPLPSGEHIIAFAQRRPYLERYAPLYGLERALFRLRHLDVIYGIDARDAFRQAVPLGDLTALEYQLLQDRDALRVLSTYAVNYLYLLRRELMQDTANIDIQMFYDLGDSYATGDSEQVHLLIYLYTHCILAESNFYAHELPAATLPTYRAMLIRLDTLIEQHFVNISLDAKLEYLVCCRLSKHQSPIADRIYQECERSLSPDGTFLIDTHNTFARVTHKHTFEASEHRNVLFIMGTTPFRPSAAPLLAS
jgi:SAM-dependent methyltransferase